MAIIVVEHSCIFERELPIKAIPIQCNGKKVTAIKSVAGWIAKLGELEIETPCGKKTFPIRTYIKNVVLPSVGGLDTSVLDGCIACDATNDCRPLSRWITSCHIRRVVVYAQVPLEFIASYLKLSPLYAFSKNSIKAGHCKFKLRKNNTCMQCVYENERGISQDFVDRLHSVLSTATL